MAAKDYSDLTREQLIGLLKARDQRTRFGLVWEANEIERDRALNGDFAYLRTRRIAPGKLLEIDHAQVWTALQLAHGETVAPFADAPFLWSGNEDAAVCYVPRFRREDAPALRRAVERSASVALYSWQPQALGQHVRAGNVSHLAIPETLARRFGLHRGGKA